MCCAILNINLINLLIYDFFFFFLENKGDLILQLEALN